MARNFKTDEFIEAISGTGGIITKIAQRMGCSWDTARKYIYSHPTVLAAFNAERESVLDMAESVVFKSIQDGDANNAKWLLNQLGKHRGFGNNSQRGDNDDLWRQEILDLLQSGRIHPSQVLHELGVDLATELFVAAGIPISRARETQEGA